MNRRQRILSDYDDIFTNGVITLGTLIIAWPIFGQN